MKSIKNIITKLWKYKDVALLLAVMVLAYFVFKGHKQASLPVNPQNPLVLSPVDSMRDANDKLYAEVKQQALTQAQTKAYADSLAKALKIAQSSIKSVDRVVTKDSIVYRDTATKAVYDGKPDSAIIAYSTDFKDAWVHIHAIAGRDTGEITFKDVDTMTRVEVVEKHLFGPTTHTIYMGNTNPHNEVTEGASFVVKEKVPGVIILPTFQYSPFNTVSKFNIGISIGSPKFALKF